MRHQESEYDARLAGFLAAADVLISISTYRLAFGFTGKGQRVIC